MASQFEIGIIGMGLIGSMMAKRFIKNGYKVNACDIPTKFEELKQFYAGEELMEIFNDGHGVSRRSDYTIYCVEAENIDKVVSLYANSTKLGAIVGGQTSVKAPEITSFEKHLPRDVHIISIHSMHAPSVNPNNQPLVLIKHRASEEKYQMVLKALKSLESEIVEITDYKEHDKITADTQAVTHLAFLSMGAAWKSAEIYPWENKAYVGGIDNVKILMTLRIFNSKPHVYAGLAILNPSAKEQIRQYAITVSTLFKLMIQEKEQLFKDRIKAAGEFVFGQKKKTPILLPDHLLEEYSLGIIPAKERLLVFLKNQSL